MLGKCLKHEFRATARQLVPLFIAMPSVGVLAGIFMGLGFRSVDGTDTSAFSVFSTLISVLLSIAMVGLIAATAIVALVMIIRRFYTSFFTDEGYLSFTLPVTVNEHITSKLITAYVWQLVGTVLSVISVFLFILVMLLVGGDLSGLLLPAEDAVSLEYMIREILSMIGMEAGEGFYATFIVLTVINFFISLASSILMIYFSISIACMIAKKHRVIAGIITYYIVSVIFTSISQTAQSLLLYVTADAFFAMLLGLGVSALLCVAQAILFYLGTKWILTHKLNLA